MLKLDQVRLVDILPSSIRNDANVIAAATSIDQQLRMLKESIDRLAIFTRLDSISDEEADELAWQFHVDFYGPPLPLEKKRELVKRSVAWHRIKGTPAAVEEIVSAAFDSAEVKEWFEYGGHPYHFKVVTREIVTPEKYGQIVKAINSIKNARSVLDDIEVNRIYQSTLEISSSFERFSYPFQAFASQQLFAGVLYDGPAVVNIPPSPVYSSVLEPSNTYYTETQAPYLITGLIYAGSSGASIPPIVKPADQSATYTGTMEVGSTYDSKTKVYKAAGTIYTGTEVLM
ncbi:phage tail protein [Paenibacillus contaminans]|nr:phage tail protein [Paenibacillus contaminans]